MRSVPPCCAHGRRTRLAVALAVVALALAAPLLARCDDLVAEAAVLNDALPPDGRDRDLVPVAPRRGLTVDVGLETDFRLALADASRAPPARSSGSPRRPRRSP